ncbi:hypothetical protein MAXJ12_12507 [Mesorhizobium alhagi CCNWXJ12-2]|uniref:Uncharacterized protein n=1 Tax=Mesorhizobium alhagi CCNWXJ12-2 TaxID=1107882 RepID=H0HQS1_9HYPH|nr:hypothetical protein MAXJ12_12507 [Mesorhizobium alhagi CCNWXJ12-2]
MIEEIRIFARIVAILVLHSDYAREPPGADSLTAVAGR